MNDKEEFTISEINTEIEEFLEANKLELNQQSIPEDDIIEILNDLKIHINKRIGEIYISKGTIFKTDIKLVLEELGRSSTSDSEFKELQSEDIFIEKDQQIIRKILDKNKEDVTEIKSAGENITIANLGFKNALNSFLSLIWISLFLLVFIFTIIFALGLISNNMSFKTLSFDQTIYIEIIFNFIPFFLAIYCVIGIYSVWKRKTNLITQKNSFVLLKVLFIAILLQIYAYSYISYRYYLEYNDFYIFLLILPSIAILSFFYAFMFPPQHNAKNSLIRSELG